MKKIDTSVISSTAGMPAKAGVLNHFLQADQETVQAIGNSLLGPYYDPAKIYVLWGCNNTGSGLTYIISSGAVFYNGEIFLITATSFVASAGQVAVGNIDTAFATSAIGDPVQFTDGSTHNVLQIRTMALSAATSGSGLADFTNWLRLNPVACNSNVAAAFGSGYTVNFRQDQSVFFTTGLTSGAGTIAWDFQGAIPGTVVRLKIVASAGTSCSVATPAGSVIINESGTITGNKTNIFYACYMGKNDGGNDEVSYKVISF